MDSIIISCFAYMALHDSLFTRSSDIIMNEQQKNLLEENAGLQMLPDLISCAGVTGREELLYHTQNAAWLGLMHTIIKFPNYNVLSRTLALSANSVSVIDKSLWSQMKVFCHDFNKLLTPTIHISKLFFFFKQCSQMHVPKIERFDYFFELYCPVALYTYTYYYGLESKNI